MAGLPDDQDYQDPDDAFRKDSDEKGSNEVVIYVTIAVFLVVIVIVLSWWWCLKRRKVDVRTMMCCSSCRKGRAHEVLSEDQADGFRINTLGRRYSVPVTPEPIESSGQKFDLGPDSEVI